MDKGIDAAPGLWQARPILIATGIMVCVIAGGSLTCVVGVVAWLNANPHFAYPESPTLMRMQDLASSAWKNRDAITADTDVAWLEANTSDLDNKGSICKILLHWVKFEPDLKRGMLTTTFSCLGPSEEGRMFVAFEIRTPRSGVDSGFRVLDVGDGTRFDWTKPIEEHHSAWLLHESRYAD